MQGQVPEEGGKGNAAPRLVAVLLQRIGHLVPQMTSLAVRAVAVLAGLAVTYLIGNRFGAAATGQYALITQTATMFAAAGLLGLDVSVVRHLAKSIASKTPLAMGLLLRVLGAGFGMMAIVVIALYLGGKTFWTPLFGDVVTIDLLLVLALMVIGRGGANLLSGLLRAQHRFALAVAVAALVVPLAVSVALFAGWADDVDGALWVAVAGGYAAVLLGLFFTIKGAAWKGPTVNVPMRAIMTSSLPLWGAGMAHVLGEWYGLAVAARMLGAADAGLYRVSFQAASMLLLTSSTLLAVYAAQISTAFHAQDREKVARLARSAVRLSTALGIPLALILLFGGKFLLGQIGEEFVAALPVLFVMVGGQLVIAMTGPSGLVVAMSGNERVNLAISLSGTVATLLIAPLAAYWGGLLALSVCIVAVMIIRNLYAYSYVKRKLGINIWAGTAIARN
ncbi:MAG: oligosaccharide flippase family protein [Alteraurantiacibacter sp.]